MSESSPSRLSPSALVAFALGVSSLALSLATALPALYVGLRAVRAINGDDGRIRGRRLAIAGMALGAFSTFATAIGVVALVLLNLQTGSDLAQCSNNLRRIGQAANRYYDLHDKQFPSATVPNPLLAPERRLSWQAALAPLLSEGAKADRKWEKLAGEIDFKDAWDSASNDGPRRTNVTPFRCPTFAGNFSHGQSGLTSYVGVAGVGFEAARLPLKDPQAGFFGFDRTLTRSDISASLGSTMMAVETTRDNGDWLAGGLATERGLDPDCDRYIGSGRPYGGLHPEGMNILWADGSVQVKNDRIDPAVFRLLARINRPADQ